ncbi:MAG: hypothetical protein PHV42_03410, partial [Candidatus Pacebacteria bacterium]|nr:hypothetical protein [Candidatus Paceibacterota bacterium]
TLVILGPITSAVNSSSFSRQTKDVMVSTYLAVEATELLHYQYDSLYLQCANNKEACDSATVPNVGSETPGEKAWRLLKARLYDATPPSVSCFDVTGCSYDFLNMLDATSTTAPSKYSPTGAECSKLSRVTDVFNTLSNNYYVCSGVPSHIVGVAHPTAYSRKVNVVSKATFPESGPSSGWYNDDLIVTSSVSFRRSNGVMRTIQIVDFLHARS